MKYAKKLDDILSKYPWYVRIRCISYRKWKKMKLPKNWRLCLIIDFMKAPKHLIDITLQTLYKICKRIQKRFKVNSLDFFYTRFSDVISKRANNTLHIPENGQNTE